MRRFQDWPTRLDGFIDAARLRPFAWGVNDCCLFACGAVEAMTGTDPGAWFRGRYRSAFAARLLLRQVAGGGLLEAVRKVAARHDIVEVDRLQAGRGDLCLSRSLDGLDGLGVCLGRRAAFMTPAGLAFVPMTQVLCCWRI